MEHICGCLKADRNIVFYLRAKFSFCQHTKVVWWLIKKKTKVTIKLLNLAQTNVITCCRNEYFPFLLKCL